MRTARLDSQWFGSGRGVALASIASGPLGVIICQCADGRRPAKPIDTLQRVLTIQPLQPSSQPTNCWRTPQCAIKGSMCRRSSHVQLIATTVPCVHKHYYVDTAKHRYSGQLSLLPFMGREMNSSLRATGWRSSMAHWGGMSDSCKPRF